MRIFKNHRFERRIGLWKCGYDKDGELWCDQRYGDWPCRVRSAEESDGQAGGEIPWEEPEWMLLSYGKPVTASESAQGHGPQLAADENVQTWWKSLGCAVGLRYG